MMTLNNKCNPQKYCHEKKSAYKNKANFVTHLQCITIDIYKEMIMQWMNT